MAVIPKDPVMLLSFLNTQLRDHFSSLEELCRTFDLEAEEIQMRLEQIDYHYDKALNQFK